MLGREGRKKSLLEFNTSFKQAGGEGRKKFLLEFKTSSKKAGGGGKKEVSPGIQHLL